MSVSTPEIDDELLPPWEELATDDGFVYYLDRGKHATQLTHPRTGKIKRIPRDLPQGWTKQVEEATGKIAFIKEETQEKTYIDPRLASAVEADPQTMGQLRQRFNSGTSALEVLEGQDLTGKVAIVTGANTGIGYETALSLALHGCEVIFACRNEATTGKAIAKIKRIKHSAGKACKFIKIDLASLRSTKEFADQVKAQYKHIDMLILNAGVYSPPQHLTEDGFETTFQVCHLSHFYLTLLLSDTFDHTSRIIVVSSELHRASFLRTSDINESMLAAPPRTFISYSAYNDAKLCNVMFAFELAKRWRSRGIAVFALHPGSLVSTEINRNYWFWRLFFVLIRPFTKSVQQAASTTVYCATAPELNGLTGLYFNNCYICGPADSTRNERKQRLLWEFSESLIERATKDF
ncbi:WW domain-containing oxidoreductase-like [Wyeomyia smithii]|uniref:WW domain-containing oxidoreductase-like n=1 Tax=Wyeomyia smithii TaxID=174621 RepID=UPI0024680489|nr:WW domain-containing oxidoreductase-like [Wyeomyia smithii]